MKAVRSVLPFRRGLPSASVISAFDPGEEIRPFIAAHHQHRPIRVLGVPYGNPIAQVSYLNAVARVAAATALLPRGARQATLHDRNLSAHAVALWAMRWI